MRRGVLAHRKRPVTANGIMEAVNSLVQAAKAKARGYRSIRNLKAIIYLIAGKLELALPT
jgi:transposase